MSFAGSWMPISAGSGHSSTFPALVSCSRKAAPKVAADRILRELFILESDDSDKMSVQNNASTQESGTLASEEIWATIYIRFISAQVLLEMLNLGQ